MKCFFCSTCVYLLARKLQSPFGNPTQVSAHYQLASTCADLPVRLARASHWLSICTQVFFHGVGSGERKEGRGDGERRESSGVILYKKCHGSVKNSILSLNGDFVILDFECFSTMKITFVRQILWMYLIRKTLFFVSQLRVTPTCNPPPRQGTPTVSPTPVKGIGALLYVHFIQTGTRLQILKQPVPRRLPSVVSFFASCLISFGSSPASRQTFRPPVLGCVLQ